MRVIPFETMLRWILREYEINNSIFGIHKSLFYKPHSTSLYSTELFGRYLATPIGPAAGPHTQFTQNIICSYLSGGRFIELKTVQVMDELDIPRPCIDMQDEGYNVEWSQELKLQESLGEYIKAWVLIHILHRLLGFEYTSPVGTIFNMSIGYNLAGITSPAMDNFINKMMNATEEIAAIQSLLKRYFPQFADIEIPTDIVNSVTLSTMHGCPPQEIGEIATYLLEQKGLHTTVKLNPTLLGKESVLDILHNKLGYTDIAITDEVFEHDLQYEDADNLIKRLKNTADKANLSFGIKLSNTLAMANSKGVLPGKEVYMSGRALYPVTINLFNKFAQQFQGELNVSYSAGANANNIVEILATGALPVTVASDLLKPGGYSNLLQYLKNISQEMENKNITSLKELSKNKLKNLQIQANAALTSEQYKKSYHAYGLPKVKAKLQAYDCITAPCIEKCPAHQNIPLYTWYIANGKYNEALQVIMQANPLPGITGYVCTHACQTSCNRNNCDKAVGIRALKRFAAEKGQFKIPTNIKNGYKVAIIGSGPSGLAAAYYLALKGFNVTIFESKTRSGGMMGIAPGFRMPKAILQADIQRILDLGVKLELSHAITIPAELITQGYDAVYLACGFAKDTALDIAGIGGSGVFGALEFLEQAANNEQLELGEKVIVIGGGNTAMDAARTAQRLIGRGVTVAYRRTKAVMPANQAEQLALIEEGSIIEELVSPIKVLRKAGKLIGLECIRNKLVTSGGKEKIEHIAGSEFTMEASAIIVAIGQCNDEKFITSSRLNFNNNGTIEVDPQTGRIGSTNIYAGGDIVHGPATVIQAVADGRQAAEAICKQFGVVKEQTPEVMFDEQNLLRIKANHARKAPANKEQTLAVGERLGFEIVEQTLSETAVVQEADRCLQCSIICDKCVEVCPNRANYSYFIKPLNVAIPIVCWQNNKIEVTQYELFNIKQQRQIIHINDFCNECGNCSTFCTHNGQPYITKPCLFLNKYDFEQAATGFYINGKYIWRKRNGSQMQLLLGKDKLDFENELLIVSMTMDFKIIKMTAKQQFNEKISLCDVIEMAVIYQGVTISLPFWKAES